MTDLAYTPIDGSECPPRPGAIRLRHAKPSRRMGVTLVVRHSLAERKLDELDEMGSRLPRDRQYLSREEYSEIHGADTVDLDMIRRFARKNQLRVVTDDPTSRTVELLGSVAAFSRAFRVEPVIFRDSIGVYRGHSGPVCIPTELAGVVRAVIGFDTRAQVRPRCFPRAEPGGGWLHATLPSYDPEEVAELYRFPKGASGRGQCIAVLEFGGGYVQRDLRTYFRDRGLPASKVSWFSAGTVKNAPSGDPFGDDAQVAMDLQIAGTVAPKARISACFGANTVRGFLRALNVTIHDRIHRPTVISIGWGAPEASWNPQALRVLDDCFKAAAAMGVTICCASGNGGSSDGVVGRLAHVDFPASSPWVLACGGSRLQSSADGTIEEVVWNSGPFGGASGGGVSDFFSRPPWQENTKVPAPVNMSKHQGRGLPDVAANADPETGYRIRVHGVEMVMGGTGAVAPLWAGLMALLNEKTGHPVGHLNPPLYEKISAAKGAFRDIPGDSNDATGQVGAYSVTRGWDPCTGFGSPNGEVLASVLSGSAPQESRKRMKQTKGSGASPRA